MLLPDAPNNEADSLTAAAVLVHRRTLGDPPSRCLPAPPLRARELAVPLTSMEARNAQLALLSGHLMDALLLIAFARTAAFAAAPERASLLSRPEAVRSMDAAGSVAAGAALGDAADVSKPLELESWEGALEADISRRHGRGEPPPLRIEPPEHTRRAHTPPPRSDGPSSDAHPTG